LIHQLLLSFSHAAKHLAHWFKYVKRSFNPSKAPG